MITRIYEIIDWDGNVVSREDYLDVLRRFYATKEIAGFVGVYEDQTKFDLGIGYIEVKDKPSLNLEGFQLVNLSDESQRAFELEISAYDESGFEVLRDIAELEARAFRFKKLGELIEI